MKNFLPESIENKKEIERQPKYRLMVSRHAERLPDGSLTPEGIETSTEKGRKLGKTAEVIKGYASDEKTKRTVFTSDYTSRASETASPLTSKQFKTVRRKDIQYDILNPDLNYLLKEGKKIIDQATIRELGLPDDTVLENLSKEEQKRIAPIRQKNQELGFRSLINSPEGVHRMAIGIAHQLADELKLVNRYDKLRKEKKSLEKDVILNTVSHGMFSESLFLEAGYIKADNGELRNISKEDLENPNFGGFIIPSESFFLEIKDPENIPDKIPVSFEKENRPKDDMVYIDKNKLLALAEEYDEWKKFNKK